jgi:Recombination endonuclease VII
MPRKKSELDVQREDRRQLVLNSFEELKVCSKCKRSLSAENFGIRTGTKLLRSVCRECERIVGRKAYNYDKVRAYALKKYYGLTIDQYNLLREKQNYRCDICLVHESETQNGLHVDHDHKTGRVRGLLCHLCNTMLGKIENKDLLERVNAYLKT